MNLDLNLGPMEPISLLDDEIESFRNELDTAREFVEARIRHLESVSRESQGEDSSPLPAETILVSDGSNPDTSQNMVANLVEIDPDPKSSDNKECGSFYDCNICLDIASDPVLTCCGHLFCWACFYQVPNVDSTSKECPVCKGEVSETSVIPIYGNSGTDPVSQTESGLKIPPRPKAHRVESIRQQRRFTRRPRVTIEQARRLIRASMGDESVLNSERVQNVDQASRVLSESAASLSSALTSAERLVEELETVISSQTPVETPLNRVSTILQAVQDEADRTVIGMGSESNESPLIFDPSYSLRARRRIRRRIRDWVRNTIGDSQDARGTRRRRLN